MIRFAQIAEGIRNISQSLFGVSPPPHPRRCGIPQDAIGGSPVDSYTVQNNTRVTLSSICSRTGSITSGAPQWRGGAPGASPGRYLQQSVDCNPINSDDIEIDPRFPFMISLFRTFGILLHCFRESCLDFRMQTGSPGSPFLLSECSHIGAVQEYPMKSSNNLQGLRHLPIPHEDLLN